MKGKYISNWTEILLHKFPCQCAHVCQNCDYRSNRFTVIARQLNFKYFTFKIKVEDICNFTAIRWPSVSC